MAKTDFKDADEYIATFPEATQQVLRQVRAAILKGVPDAEEVISYQIPAVKSGGQWVLYYSAYPKHFSLSCSPPFAAFTAFKDELAGYKQSKSAVQFPLDQPVPAKLITAMAKFQVKANAEQAAAKKPAAKKPAGKK